jgi:hypothetical protein
MKVSTSLFCLLCMICSLHVFSQRSIEPKGTFNVDLCLPEAIGNRSFKGLMQGLVYSSLYYQYRLKNTLAFGAGVHYSLANVNVIKAPNGVTGGMHTVGPFLKLSQEKFHSDRFATDFGVKAGYSFNFMNTNLNEELGNNAPIGSFNFTPMVGFILTADAASSYRFNIGYQVLGFGFSPSRLGLNTNAGFDPANFSMVTQSLIVGFGYTKYFGYSSEE